MVRSTLRLRLDPHIHVLFLIVILLRWLNMVEAKLPTLNEIKKHIPARCFEVSHYPKGHGGASRWAVC